MNDRPATTSPGHPPRAWPMWMASSVEFGPGPAAIKKTREHEHREVGSGVTDHEPEALRRG